MALLSLKIKTKSISRQYQILRRLFDTMEISYAYFIVGIFASFLIALFDGLSLGLLVPLLKGIIGMDFDFLKNLPIIKPIIVRFPELLSLAPAKFLFILLITIIFLSSIAKNICRYLYGLYNTLQKEKYVFNLNRFLFDRYLNFGKLYFDNTGNAHTFTVFKYTNYIRTILNATKSILPDIASIAVYTAILLFISWQLTAFVVLSFLPLYSSSTWIIKKIQATSTSYNAATIRLNREILNIFSCMSIVLVYNKQNEGRKQFNYLNEQIKRLEFSLSKKTGLISPLQETIILVLLLFMVSLVSIMLVRFKIGEISSYLVYFYIVRKTFPCIISLNHARSNLMRAKAPIKEIYKIFTNEGKYFIHAGRERFVTLREKIEIRNLNFSYTSKRRVLKDLNLTIKRGKMVAIVGPTGSGKSTIMNLFLRLYDCGPGTIFLDGKDITDFTIESLREKMSYVSQDILLFNNTIRYNMAFSSPRPVSEEALIDASKKAQIYDFVKKLPNGFDTQIGDRGLKLSGGERQRISIARALLKKSEMFFLDEATSSLDTHTERLIQKAIDEAAKNRTSLVVAHRLSTIKNADWIVVIKNGMLVEQGSLQDLLSKEGYFYRYWQEQKFY